MKGLFIFSNARRNDPEVAQWMQAHDDELGAIANHWFDVIRSCGDNVTEIMHDGYPTACVGQAAFAYVGAFKAHVNVGFFRGAELADPHGLMEGTGKLMRHVKLRPDKAIDETALTALIKQSWTDMQQRLQQQQQQ